MTKYRQVQDYVLRDNDPILRGMAPNNSLAERAEHAQRAAECLNICAGRNPADVARILWQAEQVGIAAAAGDAKEVACAAERMRLLLLGDDAAHATVDAERGQA